LKLRADGSTSLTRSLSDNSHLQKIRELKIEAR